MDIQTSELVLTGPDNKLDAALANLNRVNAALSHPQLAGEEDLHGVLRRTAEAAIQVVPGAMAIVYAYDARQRAFQPNLQALALPQEHAVMDAAPPPDALGQRAILHRLPVLSYQEPVVELDPRWTSLGLRVAACFPLIAAGQALATVYVLLREERPFTTLELLMLENLAGHAALSLYHTRRLAEVKAELARLEEESNRLRRASLLISSRPRLQETLEAILQMALEVTNGHYGIFRLVDKNGRHLVTRAVASEQHRPRIETLPIDSRSVMGWVALHRQPVLIPDLSAEPWAKIYYPLDTDLPMRSELAVPLIGASGRLEGVLNLESPVEQAFSEQDSHLLQALATQAVIAIQEARLLDALQEVAQLLLAQPYRQVLARLAELACELLNGDACAIWTLQNDVLLLQAASGEHEHAERLPLVGSLAGQAILQRRPVSATDVQADLRFHRPDLAARQGWRRALVVPMWGDDEQAPGGAFGIYSMSEDAGLLTESEWDSKVLLFLAHYAALAIHNAARQEALRAAQERHAIAETFAAVGDLAANLLHQLNNKVGAIPARVQGIQERCEATVASDPYLANNLAEIERSATEAMASVRASLSHLHPIHLTPVNVAACVRAAITSAHLPTTVRVEMENLDRLPPVVAAKSSLIMVFANLLDNASDAMRGEGTIRIRGTVSGEGVRIEVSDDGPGISPELHERIFEFDYSARGGTRRGKLGFGLWWVKTLMTRLGGTVAVQSDGKSGTTFQLWLPAIKERSQ